MKKMYLSIKFRKMQGFICYNIGTAWNAFWKQQVNQTELNNKDSFHKYFDKCKILGDHGWNTLVYDR